MTTTLCPRGPRGERGKADSLIADHLDDDRLNNDPGNLVPACNRCNTTRGATDAR